tara:strand:- start:13463 stop:14086 length:624 start_codon:yes stop_codon:yes gene_type:complete
MHINLPYIIAFVAPCFALFSAFSFVAIFIYKPFKHEIIEEENEIYKKKYLDEFNSLQVKEISNDQLDKLCELTHDEETPQGTVTIIYNNIYGSFWYYSKYKNIYFDYLEVAARKYIIKYDCKCIHIKYKKLLDKNNTEEVPTAVIKSDVFVKVNKSTKNLTKNVDIKEYNRFTYKGNEYANVVSHKEKKGKEINYQNYKQSVYKKAE